jgi:hypothetical protein
MLVQLKIDRGKIITEARASLVNASRAARGLLDSWKAQHDALLKRLADKESELAAQGLKVQAGENKA